MEAGVCSLQETGDMERLLCPGAPQHPVWFQYLVVVCGAWALSQAEASLNPGSAIYQQPRVGKVS